MKQILIVDDDPTFNSMLTAFLERKNYGVCSAHSSGSALTMLKEQSFDLILTDFKLPDIDGLAFIQKMKQQHIDVPFILITNYSDIRTAVRSMKLGAYEFVTKPVNPDELLITMEKAMRGESKAGGDFTDSLPPNAGPEDYIIGKNAASLQLWEHIEMVAPTKMNVLITGESGTGKEHIARIVHQKSKRSKENFVAIDCGLLSDDLAGSELFGHVKGAFTGAANDKKGHFEAADKGTLFLDEVGNLPYSVQMKLLRAIQERTIRRLGGEKEIKIDVRIIAATNESMVQSIDRQKFRNDLYHRLNEFELKVPALKERLEDLEEYASFFIKEAAHELEKKMEGITPEAIAMLKKYSWPGNLRELKNIIKRATLLSKETFITPAHLPDDLLRYDSTPAHPATGIETGTDLRQLQEHQEREVIEKVLRENKFNKSRAAKILNIDRTTLYNKIRQYGIDA